MQDRFLKIEADDQWDTKWGQRITLKNTVRLNIKSQPLILMSQSCKEIFGTDHRTFSMAKRQENNMTGMIHIKYVSEPMKTYKQLLSFLLASVFMPPLKFSFHLLFFFFFIFLLQGLRCRVVQDTAGGLNTIIKVTQITLVSSASVCPACPCVPMWSRLFANCHFESVNSMYGMCGS